MDNKQSQFTECSCGNVIKRLEVEITALRMFREASPDQYRQFWLSTGLNLTEPGEKGPTHIQLECGEFPQIEVNIEILRVAMILANEALIAAERYDSLSKLKSEASNSDTHIELPRPDQQSLAQGYNIVCPVCRDVMTQGTSTLVVLANCAHVTCGLCAGKCVRCPVCANKINFKSVLLL
jgi:hypothetical protein